MVPHLVLAKGVCTVFGSRLIGFLRSNAAKPSTSREDGLHVAALVSGISRLPRRNRQGATDTTGYRSENWRWSSSANNDVTTVFAIPCFAATQERFSPPPDFSRIEQLLPDWTVRIRRVTTIFKSVSPFFSIPYQSPAAGALLAPTKFSPRVDHYAKQPD